MLPPPPGTQHLKLAGPGHRPVRVLVLHEDVKRQLPPLPHEVLVQHLMSSGVPGQAFEMYLPPAEVHFAVAMQTPGAPPEPVHAPLTADRSMRVWAWTRFGMTRMAIERRDDVYMLTDCFCLSRLCA